MIFYNNKTIHPKFSVEWFFSVLNFVLRVQELFHFCDLHVLDCFSGIVRTWLNRSFSERFRKFERNNTTFFISNKNNRVFFVESNMKSFSAASSELLNKERVFVLIKVVHIEFTFTCHSSKHCRRVGSPLDITDRETKIEGHNRSSHVAQPHFNGPVS